MVEAGLAMLLFLLEILKYRKAYDLFGGKKIQNIWLSVPVGIGLFILLVINQDIRSSGKYVIVYIITIILLFFLLRGKWQERIISLLIIFFASNVIELLIFTIFDIGKLCILEERRILMYEAQLGSFTVLFFLYIISLVKERLKKKAISLKNVIYKKIYYFVILMAITMLCTIAGLNFSASYVTNSKFTGFAFILCILSYLGIGILGVFVLYIKKMNQQMEEVLQSEKMLKDMQKQYYEALLEKEEDTRRYRHDMVNHLLCLNSLAQQEKIEELKMYLDQMQNQTQIIQNKSYVTGHQVLDVITNYYLTPLQNVDIKLSGQISEALEYDNVSLCIIYANLLKNAVEEVERSKEGERFININFKQGIEYFRMIIQNSLSEESSKKENMLVTSKKDKKNHGIGLRNVHRTIEENGGSIKINHDSTSFTVEVILKLNNHSRS